VAGCDAAVLRGTPPGAERLLAAGCAVLDAPAAPAVARLALGREEGPGTLAALYCRAPAIRPAAGGA
jgi:hypothetical protein